MPFIQAPFPHIAVHVIQAPGIGRETGYVCGLLPIIALGAISINVIAVVVGQIWRQRGPEIKRRGSASPAGVLPLGFTGQGVTAAGALAKAVAKFHCIKYLRQYYLELVLKVTVI